jgi:Lipid A 3-O-deacylase (PagL)
MYTFSSALLLTLLNLVPSSTTYAQSTIADNPAASTTTDVSPATSPHRYRELSFYSAQTFDNPQILSYLSGEHLFLTGVRLTSRLFTTPHLFIGGNLDLKPLAIFSRYVANCGPSTYGGCETVGNTYGGGGSVGFQFAPRNSWRWQPFFDVDGGLIAFTRDIPLDNTRRVNLTLEYGPGALIPVRGNNAIRAGVWVFHFSNASTAYRHWNPGFDGLMLYVSYTYRNFSFHRHPPRRE